MTNSFGELENAQLLFLIGTNMTEAHPVASYYVKRALKKGAKLIGVDPRKHALAEWANIFAQIKVGSDVAFLNGIMHVLISEGLYDKTYVEANCADFEALKSKVMEYPPERAAQVSGVPVETIKKIAQTLASIKPAMLCYTLGITEHTCGKNNVMSIANLQMLLGNVGVEGGGVNPLRGQNNVQGACDMGALPNVYPGYQAVTNPESRAKFAQAWGAENLPDKIGLMMPDMMAGLSSKKVRAFFILGENLASSEPNITHVEQELASAEFLVVCDIFPTETTRFAHVILPSAAWCESDGTFTNSERRVNAYARSRSSRAGEARLVDLQGNRQHGLQWQSDAQEIWDNEVSVLSRLMAGSSIRASNRMDCSGPARASIIRGRSSCTKAGRSHAGRDCSRRSIGHLRQKLPMKNIRSF
jgi:formate dehydrogenase major subunit